MEDAEHILYGVILKLLHKSGDNIVAEPFWSRLSYASTPRLAVNYFSNQIYNSTEK